MRGRRNKLQKVSYSQLPGDDETSLNTTKSRIVIGYNFGHTKFSTWLEAYYNTNFVKCVNSVLKT